MHQPLLVLDHMELSRIGSDFFRPDIQVRGLVIQEVYHLELTKNRPNLKKFQTDEYLIASPSQSLVIELSSVALVKLDAEAKFASLQSGSKNTKLYIDLTHSSQDFHHDNLKILGFPSDNIFFVTKTQKIRLQKVKQSGNFAHYVKVATCQLSRTKLQIR